MSIIEKQITMNKVTAEQAKQARESFKNSVAKLSAKLQQKNIKNRKGTSAKQLASAKEKYNLVVKAASKNLSREVVANKQARKKYYINLVAQTRATRLREQQAVAGLNA